MLEILNGFKINSKDYKDFNHKLFNKKNILVLDFLKSLPQLQFLYTAYVNPVNVQFTWHFFNSIFEPIICKFCGQPSGVHCIKNRRISKNIVYNDICSSKECISLKFQMNFKQIHNVSNPGQMINHLEKIRKTSRKKFGCDHHSSTPLFIEKSILTNQKKYGVDYPMCLPEFQEKAKKTLKENYGVDYPMCLPEFQDKSKKTNQKNFGVDYPLQNDVIFQKSLKNSYKSKKYILPSGQIIKIQGYENRFLDEYFKEGGLETNIITQPKDLNIWYFDIEGGKHKYFPDFYLLKENKIIEVKSTWTYKRDLDKNILKMKACQQNNYNFEFKIYTGLEKD